jgi:hypothetical protein
MQIVLMGLCRNSVSHRGFWRKGRLLIFAVSKIEDMLFEFKAHYYAEELPRWSAGADRSESATGSGLPATQDGAGKRQKAARFTPRPPFRTD